MSEIDDGGLVGNTYEEETSNPILDERSRVRRRNASRLMDGLESTSVETPPEPDGMRHVYHQYTIRTEDRQGLQAVLEEHDVGYGVYYPTCIQEQPAYSDIDHSASVAERMASEVLSLPVHPNVSAGDVDTIIEVISNYE